MDIEYLKLIKIDHENNTVSEENLAKLVNIKDYVMAIVKQITDNKGDRRYKFKETEFTMKTLVDKVVMDVDRDAQVLDMAKRLLEKENAKQKQIGGLTEIQKGVMLVAFCKMTSTEYKVIICKADYSEYIEEVSGEKKRGLDIKRKIFKSFAANVTMKAGSFDYGDIVTYDVNTKRAVYWYDEFLDLYELLSDERNTEKAWYAIKAKILTPIYKNHKKDYLVLRNRTLGYMRSEGEFSIEEYADKILAAYQPIDPKLKMDELANAARALPEKQGFDNNFNKKPSSITARASKAEIPLTADIDLLIKNEIPKLEETIRPYEKDGVKYIMVQSDDGYDFAEGLKEKEEAE